MWLWTDSSYLANYSSHSPTRFMARTFSSQPPTQHSGPFYIYLNHQAALSSCHCHRIRFEANAAEVFFDSIGSCTNRYCILSINTSCTRIELAGNNLKDIIEEPLSIVGISKNIVQLTNRVELLCKERTKQNKALLRPIEERKKNQLEIKRENRRHFKRGRYSAQNSTTM